MTLPERLTYPPSHVPSPVGELLLAATPRGGLVGDQPVKGEVSIATTGAGDPAAFARVQAGTLDPSRALAEAYRRNNAGSYAEAAEFFAAVTNIGEGPLSKSESLAHLPWHV